MIILHKDIRHKTHILGANHEKGPYAIYGQPFSQGGEGIRCQPRGSMDTVIYVDKQRMFRSDYTDGKADLGLRCLHMTKEPFSHVVHHIYEIKSAKAGAGIFLKPSRRRSVS